MFLRIYILVCLLLCFSFKSRLAAQSVLAQGKWVKLAFVKGGIYKIDYNYLQNIGFNPQQINPRNIHIHGYGNGMLPQNNSSLRIEDLPENSIFIQGENDQQFNEQDYILFYAQNPDAWSYNVSTQIFEHQKNLYSDSSFYFITINESAGLRVQTQASTTGATQNITTFDEYVFFEQDKVNILQSGRNWYGESFGNGTSSNYDFKIEGLVGNSILKINSSIMGNVSQTSGMALKANNQSIGNQTIPAISQGRYDGKGVEVSNLFLVNQNTLGNTSDLRINLTYSGTSGTAYLNYLRLNYKKSLKLYGNQTVFRSLESLNTAISNFTVGETSNDLQIWDISNPVQPLSQNYQFSGNQASFAANTTTLKEFVLFRGSDFQTPVFFQTVTNQDLHSLSVPDLIIITPTQFLGQAQRLADFRRTHDGLLVQLVTTDQIYNEFSSGRQDISAIRDFIRHLYKKDNNRLKYVLLFGDASYDYKNRFQPNTNFIPIYESRESLQPIYSYSSDDYYGFMEETEGEWIEGPGFNPANDHTLEIGIGRLPVKSVQEAQTMVDKLIHYSSNLKTMGSWRNRVCFVADDGDGNIHTSDAEKLADTIRANYKSYNIDKLYVDAFNQIAEGGGEKVPSLKTALNKTIEKGALIINYTGHGAEIGWAEEDVLDIQQIEDWRNYNQLPLIVTATCEFGRYDDPFKVSGAEYAVLNSKGGAIALITTTRPVFAYTNFLLNKAFYNTVFQPENGQKPRLGDLIRKTKNNSLNGSLNRNFSLLGDPSMRLAYPEYNVVATKLNQKAINLPLDTLKALGKIKIEGEIQNSGNAILTDFNGVMEVSVFDKDQTFATIGNQNSKLNYQLLKNLLFKGLVTVSQGKFSFEFIVPKDINYQFGRGKMSFYAQKNNSLADANGFFADIIVGGTQSNALPDNTPPEIQLFMDNENFISGGQVRQNTILIAKISDENGINISQFGVGHEINADIENGEGNYIMNDYYTADTNTYKKGTVRYPFKDLSLGRKTLNFKVWDTYNNSSKKSIDFIVIENILEINQLLNYPNPFSDQTNFRFEHNREDEDISIQLLIYDSEGRFRNELNYEFNNSTSPTEINWNGTDDSGNPINAGIYIYKLIVRSSKDGANSLKEGKLIVLR